MTRRYMYMNMVTYILYDADEGDDGACLSVVLLTAQDVGPGHHHPQVVLVGHTPFGGGHLQTDLFH